MKINAAKEAISFVKDGMNLGLGTGSTVDEFLILLSKEIKNGLNICGVPTSEKTRDLSNKLSIPLTTLESVKKLDLTIDGADEIDNELSLIKGGGGALTREKIIASASKTFICIIDKSKFVDRFGKFPVAIEVIPMARSFVSRQVVAMGGRPAYRVGFITDNGNQIIDVSNLNFDVPYETESRINRIPGVVENGIFAARKADKIIVADGQKVSELK